MIGMQAHKRAATSAAFVRMTKLTIASSVKLSIQYLLRILSGDPDLQLASALLSGLLA